MKKYNLPPILEGKTLRSALFNRILHNCAQEDDSYTEMIEKALFLYIERAEDVERNLLKYVSKYGAL